MPTLVMAQFDDKTGQVEVEYNTSDRLTLVRAVVPVGRSVSVSLRRADRTGTTYTRTFGPGTNTLVIPTTVAGRIQLTRPTLDGQGRPDARGRLEGMDGWIEVS